MISCVCLNFTSMPNVIPLILPEASGQAILGWKEAFFYVYFIL